MLRLMLLVLFYLLVPYAANGASNFEDPSTHQLSDASRLERANPWQAAVIYCDAARGGSLEAYYRLGMLFAFGQGVPQDRTVAASLFATAAQQGHQEAANMLDTIHYQTERPPACVLSNVKPPHGPPATLRWSNDASLDAILASLSKNKAWLVNMIKQIATWHRVDPRLALAIVSVESAFKPDAVSKANAMGLMQLIPATAARFNVRDAFDASQNVKGGVRYLRWLLDRYNDDIELVAAAYNAGEGAVDKYNGVPPYQETVHYVSKVLGRYRARKHAFTPINEKL